MVALFAALLLSLSQPNQPELTVEAVGAQTRCPSPADVTSALELHGIFAARGGGPRWTFSYRPEAQAALEVLLRDPQGGLRLRRSVTVAQSPCADVAAVFGWCGGPAPPPGSRCAKAVKRVVPLAVVP